MEDAKKRKLVDGESLTNLKETTSFSSVGELRKLLDPLSKTQLVDILAKAGSEYPSIAQEIKSIASADPALRKLFVRGLAWNTTSETLFDAFREHGEIEEGAVIYDKVTGKSRGYGFITYKDMDSSQKAIKAPSKMLDGRMAVCNLASEGLTSTSSTPDQALRKLYIGGLSPETTSEMLLSYFGRHGQIEEGSVAYEKDSTRSRGFGFVTYTTVEAAKKAIDDPQTMLGGRNITVKLADNNKGKVGQQQLPPAVVQVPVNMTAGYQQVGGGPPVGYTYPAGFQQAGGGPPVGYTYPAGFQQVGGGPPVGYTYPQSRVAYPGSYASQTAAAATYSAQLQYPHPQYAIKKEMPLSPTGYPYYTANQ